MNKYPIFLINILGNDILELLLFYLDNITLYRILQNEYSESLEIYLFQRIFCQQKENFYVNNNQIKTLENSLLNGKIIFSKAEIKNFSDFDKAFVKRYWKYIDYQHMFYFCGINETIQYWIELDNVEILQKIFSSYQRINISNDRIKSIEMVKFLIKYSSITYQKLAICATNSATASYCLSQIDSYIFDVKQLSSIETFEVLRSYLNIDEVIKYSIAKSSKLFIYLIENYHFSITNSDLRYTNKIYNSQYRKSLKYLQEKKILPALINDVSFMGETLLSFFIGKYLFGMSFYYKKIIDLLLQYGADPNIGNKIRNYEILNAEIDDIYYLVDRKELILTNLKKLFEQLFNAGLTKDNLNERTLSFLKKNSEIFL